jgi:hypothetical protein
MGMKIIFDIIAEFLMRVCELTHLLPEPYHDKVQGIFIDIIGYHCPFATWAFQIDEKFGSNRWLVKK